MDIIDNLKKIGKNWRLTALVIWLLIGVAVIPYPNPDVSFIGILIFLPFLVFLMFLFLLSLISKRDIFEYSVGKTILFLLVSLPIMLLISVVLVFMFAIAVITYVFFTSWFIFYGCYLVGKKVDDKLVHKGSGSAFLRFLIFFGGLAIALLLLFLFIIGPTIFDFSIILEKRIDFPWYLNGVFLIVGGVLIGLAIICLIYMFKKSFNGWFGLFTILISIYSLFLVLKIYMGLVGTNTDPKELASIWAYVALILPDLFIVFYSLSTLMGSQAELLSKRIKRFGMDTIIIWLILSKVTYEFIHYFPYEIFNVVTIPFSDILSALNNDLINHIKNISVLAFFIALLVVIGIYEIHKYHKDRKKPREDGTEEEKEIASLEPSPYESQPVMEEDNKEKLDSGEIKEGNGNKVENSNEDA